jgi:hypothetical protein
MLYCFIFILSLLWCIKGSDSLGKDASEINVSSLEHLSDRVSLIPAHLLLLPLAHGRVLLSWHSGVAIHKGLVGSDELFVLSGHLL